MPVPQRILNIELRHALDPRGLSQSDLTRDHFAPNLTEIQHDLEVLRREADTGLLPGLGQGGGGHGGYPLGYCKPIRDFTLQRLLNPTGSDAERPAFSSIQRFRAAGGLVKGVWGIQKDRFFQNAIQVGDLWFDLANDTVDRDRPPVEILPLAEAQFSEVTSFEQYAKVAESYWGVTVVPNRYLPDLAATFPVLLYGAERPAMIAAPVTLTPRSIREDYAPARSFLLEGPFRERELPRDLAADLARAGDGTAEAMSPEQLEQAVTAERQAAATLCESAFLERFTILLQKATRFMAPE